MNIKLIDGIKGLEGELMENVAAKGILSAICGSFCYIFGSWDVYLQVLLIFIVIDIMTGFMASYAVGTEISAKKMRLGGFRKVSMLLLVAVAFQLDKMLGVTYLRYAMVVYSILTEVISIFKNVDAYGTGVPTFLKNLIRTLLNKIDKGDINIKTDITEKDDVDDDEAM